MKLSKVSLLQRAHTTRKPCIILFFFRKTVSRFRIWSFMASLVMNVILFSFQNYVTELFFGMVFLFFVDAMLHYILVHELIEVILLSKF